MKTNNQIIRMVEAIRNGALSGAPAGGVEGTYTADVLSVEPLAIKMHNITITENLYINPALMTKASDSGEKMKQIFQASFETPKHTHF